MSSLAECSTLTPGERKTSASGERSPAASGSISQVLLPSETWIRPSLWKKVLVRTNSVSSPNTGASAHPWEASANASLLSIGMKDWGSEAMLLLCQNNRLPASPEGARLVREPNRDKVCGLEDLSRKSHARHHQNHLDRMLHGGSAGCRRPRRGADLRHPARDLSR